MILMIKEISNNNNFNIVIVSYGNSDAAEIICNFNKRLSKPLPIYIRIKAKDVFNFIAKLEKAIGKNFHFKHRGEQIKIHFNDITVFSKAKKVFSQAEVQFHNFALPNEKQFSLVLKNLPQVESNIIVEELKSYKHNSMNCIMLRSNKDSSFYHINFPANTAFT